MRKSPLQTVPPCRAVYPTQNVSQMGMYSAQIGTRWCLSRVEPLQSGAKQQQPSIIGHIRPPAATQHHGLPAAAFALIWSRAMADHRACGWAVSDPRGQIQGPHPLPESAVKASLHQRSRILTGSIVFLRRLAATMRIFAGPKASDRRTDGQSSNSAIRPPRRT